MPGTCMQTMRGKWAKNPTTEEIKDVLTAIWEVIKNHPEYKKDPFKLVWSLDNVAVHKLAVQHWDHHKCWRVQRGIKGVLKQPPPYSPDLHQVVEHAIGDFTSKFKAEVADSMLHHKPLPRDVNGWVQFAEDVFKGVVDAPSVRANIAKLKRETYPAVIQDGGVYPVPSKT